jgi:hypothetical protein
LVFCAILCSHEIAQKSSKRALWSPPYFFVLRGRANACGSRARPARSPRRGGGRACGRVLSGPARVMVGVLARALAARTLTGATRHVGSACVVISARSHVGSGEARGDGVARLQRTRARSQRGSPKRRARGGRARMTAARARVRAVNQNQLTMRASAARARRTAGNRWSAAFSENTRPPQRRGRLSRGVLSACSSGAATVPAYMFCARRGSARGLEALTVPGSCTRPNARDETLDSSGGANMTSPKQAARDTLYGTLWACKDGRN